MAGNPQSRRYPRIALPRGMLVAWRTAAGRVVSRVATLGLGGVFIEASNPPAVGEVIELCFDVPGGEVRARATVRTSQKGKGMGVAFTAMGSEPRARLHRLLLRLLGEWER